MITLTATINLIGNSNSSGLSDVTINLAKNNVSSQISEVVGRKATESNAFIIGSSKVGDGSIYTNKVDYYIGLGLSDENGKLPSLNSLSIKLNGINNFFITFDTTNKKHPRYIEIFPESKEMTISAVSSDEGVDIGAITVYPFYTQYKFDKRINGAFTSEGNGTVTRIDDYTVEYSGYSDFPNYTETATYTVSYKSFIIMLNNARLHISDLQDFSACNFIISEYNCANSPLVITGIYAKSTIDIDKKNLVSLNRSIFDRSDIKFPSYGIISNTGNIEFNDLDGEIREYAEKLLLTSDMKAEISMNDTLRGSSEVIGKFETREWDYDNDSRIVSVSLKDDLEEWQDIQIEAINYDPRNPYAILPNGSMSDLYKWLQERTPAKYNMLTYNNLSRETKEILYSTKITYPILKSSNLWNQWTKLCQVCGLYIYKNNNGNTTCSYTYGS